MENGKQIPRDLKQAYRTSYLLAGYINKNLAADEQLELDAWIAESDHNRQLFLELTDKNNVEKAMEFIEGVDVEKNLRKSKAGKHFNPPPKVIRLRPFLVVAASVIAIVLLIWFFRSLSRISEEPVIVKAVQQEIIPVAGNTVLSLGNGTEIILGNDTIINNEAAVRGKQKELVYSSNGADPSVAFHTLSVGAGSEYKLKLADGTIVYLNAMSSIRYPASFSGNTRKVELTGEAFFEVVHDAAKPFFVQAGTLLVEDIGTSFNISSYSDEPVINTTLIEGSIKLFSAALGKEVLMKPGDQASFSEKGIDVNKDIDTAAAIAWKRNQFRFVNMPLQSIMKQVSRWYNAEIIYEDTLNVHLNATIDRNVPVSQLLHLLSGTEDAHFRIEGRKIFIHK